MPTTTKRPSETPPNNTSLTTSHEASVASPHDTSTRSAHVPPVLSLVQELPDNPNPRIHILGDDLNSKYIAHAMSRMHEHVELLSWRGDPFYSKPRNVETNFYEDSLKESLVEPNGARLSGTSDSNSHIENLVLGGHGGDAVRVLRKVKHRLNSSSTICLMNDGLGVLEDVRERVFSGRQKSDPHFLLGHMSHRISYNRKFDSIREMRRGRMVLTSPWKAGTDKSENQLSTIESTLATSLQNVSDFQSSMAGYQEWLKFKMPSVILGAVVDPCCVMFNTDYQGLFKNKDALSIMDNLLSEILVVLDNMPELVGSNVGDMIREAPQRMSILRRLILGRKDQPSPMLQLLHRGGYTDVNYLNGYFIKRGKELGLDLPRNNMARDLVRGWHQSKTLERNKWMPIDEKPLKIDRRNRLETHGERWVVPRS